MAASPRCPNVHRSGSLLTAGSAVAMLLSGPAMAQVEVNTCGQSVAVTGGYLATDLDCTGTAGSAVLLHGGTLDLRGYTLTAGETGVECDLPCTVTSSVPGAQIRNALLRAVTVGPAYFAPIELKVENIGLDGNYSGIYSGSKVVASNLSISNTGVLGIYAKVVRATNVTVDGAYTGVDGSSVRISDSNLSNAENGVGAVVRLRMERTTVTGTTNAGTLSGHRTQIRDSFLIDNLGVGVQAWGNDAGMLRISGSTVSGNAEQGIYASTKVNLKNTAVTDNGMEGISAGYPVRITENTLVSGNGLDGVRVAAGFECLRIVARDSSLLGNGLDPSCGSSRTCADLSSCARPVLDTVMCEHSYDITSGFPGTDWNVCALD